MKRRRPVFGLLGALALLCLAATYQDEEKKETTAAPGGLVHIIPLDGQVDWTLHAFVDRATKAAIQAKADLVVFEVDNPGGRIDAMEAIARRILTVEEAGIRNVCFIRPNDKDPIGGAFSAASYLAMCSQKIYIYPGQLIGDAQPIMMGGEKGYIELGEKIVTVMRAKFRDIAERRGYPPRLAESMVDKNVEVFDVLVDGERKFLTQGDIESAKDEGRQVDAKSAPVVKKGHLLTMTEKEAVDFGFAKRMRTRAEVYTDLGFTMTSEFQYRFSWSESLVSFVTSPFVQFLLMIVGILGIWIEMKTPGFGVPGIAGVAAFGILLFGHHIAGLAEMTEILLFVVGIALLAVEVFLIPGIGVFGILGVLCIFSGLILSFQNFVIPTNPWEGDILLSSLGRVLFGFLGSSILFFVIVRFMPRVPFLNKYILSAELRREDGSVSPSQPVSDMLVGKTGVVVTPLRPGGKVEIGGTVYDVVAEGDYIQKGVPVTVIELSGARIVVERAQKS